MSKLSGSFTIGIDKTADLNPPDVECQWEIEFDGEPDLEKVLLGYYRKNYEAGLKRVVGEQARAFAAPLASMQRDIDALRKARAVVDAQTDADAALAALDRFNGLYKKSLPVQVAEYGDYLVRAVDNVRRQQLAGFGKVFEAEALEQARKTIRREIGNKRVRHVTNITLRGALLLGGAAGALAAAGASFGAALPALAALAVVGAALGGATTLISMAKSIADLRDLERRSMNLLVKDVAAMVAELDAVSTSVKGLGKHVNDVSMYYSNRREQTAVLELRMKELERQLGTAAAETERLRDAVPKIHKAQKARLADATQRVEKARQACVASSRRDGELKAALTSATALVGDLGKIPYRDVKGVADGLSRIDMKDPATYLAIVDALAGLLRAGSGAGKATTHR